MIRLLALLAELGPALPIVLGGIWLAAHLKLIGFNTFVREWEPTIRLFLAIISIAGALNWLYFIKIADSKPQTLLPPTTATSQFEQVSKKDNLRVRSCPGVKTTCETVVFLEASSKVETYLDKRTIVVEKSGAQTPWILVKHYSGRYCEPLDTTDGSTCSNWRTSKGSVGWVNATYLYP